MSRRSSRRWCLVAAAAAAFAVVAIMTGTAEAGDGEVATSSASGGQASYYAVDWVDARTGWVGGIAEGKAVIGWTDSAGAQWNWVSPQPPEKTPEAPPSSDGSVEARAASGWEGRVVTALDFVDSEHGWAALDDGTILASSDGGRSWSTQAPGSFANRDNNWGYADLSMADASHGCAVGSWVGFIGVVQPQVALTKTGQDWITARLSNWPGSFLTGVCMVDERHVWAVGSSPADDPTPLVLASDDGGETWQRQMNGLPKDGSTLHAVSFVDLQHGWVVGDLGSVYVTADGGTTWWRQDSGVSVSLLGVRLRSDGVGWAVGEQGAVLVTTNGGASWASASLESGGKSKASEPGGKTNCSEPGGKSNAILRAVAIAERKAWVVGDGGVIVAEESPILGSGLPLFGDIGSSPHKKAIESLALAGVVNGFADGSYRPDEPAKRAQFAKMVVLALGLARAQGKDVASLQTLPGGAPAAEGQAVGLIAQSPGLEGQSPGLEGNAPFVDLGTPDSRGYPHVFVTAAYASGVVQGRDPDQRVFAAWEPLPRDEAVTMAVRAVLHALPSLLVTPPKEAFSFFSSVGEPHGSYLRLAEYNGILCCLPGVCPRWNLSSPLTRGEAAQVLYNLKLAAPRPVRDQQ